MGFVPTMGIQTSNAGGMARRVTVGRNTNPLAVFCRPPPGSPANERIGPRLRANSKYDVRRMAGAVAGWHNI